MIRDTNASNDGDLVLVIDDEPAIRGLATALARTMGLRTMSAADGIEGLRLARRHQPTVVLTDVSMPGLDGREVCHSLKADPACAASHVIVMSALPSVAADGGDAHRRFLADDYVAKPLDVDHLRSLLAAHMGREGAR